MNKTNRKPALLSNLSTNESTTLPFHQRRLSTLTDSTINPTETLVWDRMRPSSHSLEMNKIRNGKRSFSKNQTSRNVRIKQERVRDSDKNNDKVWESPLIETKRLKNLKETILPRKNGIDFKRRFLQNQRNHSCYEASSDKISPVKGMSSRVRKQSAVTPYLKLTKKQVRECQMDDKIKEASEFNKRMEHIGEFLDEQKLFQRLSIYSSQTMRSSLRIYKEDLQKIICQRYGKDRISSFLDFEYIEDYDSMLERMNDMMKFSLEQVHILVYITMDQNKDGLITPEDILSLIGAKKQKMNANYLAMEDINFIIKYLKQKQRRSGSITDTLSSKHKFLKDEGLTLVKHRTMNYQRMREQADIQGKQRKNKLITTRMHQYLYTLTFKNLQNQSLTNWNSIKTKTISSDERNAIDFSINFQTFQEIFKQTIPQTFIDILFLIGGLEIPQIRYDPVDESVLRDPAIQQSPFYEIKTVENIKQIIRELKQFNKNTPTVFSSF